MKKVGKNFTDRIFDLFKNNKEFFLILLFGLFLRLVFMHEQGLSNDELSAWFRTRFQTWDSFWQYGVKAGDMHPFLYQFITFIWVKVFGTSEYGMRSLSLVFYLLNSGLIYLIAKRYFSKSGGLVVLALYTGLSFTIINSVFTRPYNSGTFFLLLSFLAILNLKNQKNAGWSQVLILTIGFSGAMLSHYFAFLTAFVMGGIALFCIGKEKRKYLIISGFLAVLLFLPHLHVTFFQLQRGGLGWLAAPGYNWPIWFLHLFFNESWTLFALIAGVFTAAIRLNHRFFWNMNSYFAVSVFTITFVLGFAVSHVFTPILRELVMLFLLPFLLLPIFSLVDFKNSVQRNGMLILLVLFPTVDSFFRNNILEPIHFGVFRELGQEINQCDRLYGRKNITFASNFNNVEYINFYLNKPLKESIIDWEKPEAIINLGDRIKNSKTTYFCYSFNNKYHTPMFLEMIRFYFPRLERKLETKYSTFYLYSRKKGQSKNHSFYSKTLGLNNSDAEFIGDTELKIKQLPKLTSKEYYLVESYGSTVNQSSFYLVATINRDGKMLMKDSLPVFYAAFDQSYFQSNSSKSIYKLAFNLPENLVETDVLKIYIWNPNKSKLNISGIKLKVGS